MMRILRIAPAALAGWLIGLLSAAVVHAQASEPPNIVLIISDDQAWTDYSFMGHPHIRTPHLDRLAEGGVLFPRGYVPTALCRPSLLTLATGHYAHRHGITGNDPSPRHADPDSDLFRQRRTRLVSYIDALETLPELLSERGYLSLQTGKWWEGDFQRGGFTHGMSAGFPEAGGRHGDRGLQIGRDGMGPVVRFVNDAVAADRPFLVWFAPMLPHTPHNPPAQFAIESDEDLPAFVSRYYAMCQWFDETCGQLVQVIEDAGVIDNTLFVFVTDNGWIQKPDGPRYALRSKQTPFEGGVRTPIIFSWPGRLPASRRSELVSSIDLVPTMLGAVGARIPDQLPGRNLWPALTSGDPLDRETLFGEAFAHDIADIEDPQASLLFRWCIENNWKLILTYDGEVNRYAATHPRTDRRPQLYDLSLDPHEENNVAARHPEVVRRLAARIADWYPVPRRRVLEVWED